jgi:hypothetical protein
MFALPGGAVVELLAWAVSDEGPASVDNGPAMTSTLAALSFALGAGAPPAALLEKLPGPTLVLVLLVLQETGRYWMPTTPLPGFAI